MVEDESEMPEKCQCGNSQQNEYYGEGLQ